MLDQLIHPQRRTFLAASGAWLAFHSSLKAQSLPPIDVHCDGCIASINVMPFWGDSSGAEVRGILISNLKRSGAVAVVEATQEYFPRIEGSVTNSAADEIQVQIRLMRSASDFDTFTTKVRRDQLRMSAHVISDKVYKKLSKQAQGMFASKLAYVDKRASQLGTQYTLFIADSDGQRPHALLRSSHPIQAPAWSPNGKQILYTSFEALNSNPVRKPRLWIIDVYTGKRQVLGDYPGSAGFGTWSVDGTRVIASFSHSGDTKLYELDLTQASRPTRISFAGDGYSEVEPSIARTGALYFCTDTKGNFSIHQMDRRITAASPQSTPLTKFESSSPNVNKDGTQLAFIDRSANGQLCVMDLQTRVITRFAGAHQAEGPCFSPNGRLIVYTARRRGYSELRTVSLDAPDQAPQPITQGSGASWGPLLQSA